MKTPASVKTAKAAAALRANVTDYIALGTLAYSVTVKLIKLLRAKRTNPHAILAQVSLLFEQINATFHLRISLDTIEKCVAAVLGVLKDSKR